MSYSLVTREKAIKFRKKGFSIKEISEKLNIAKSTSSLWLRDINLNQIALKRLQKRKILGQYKSMQIAAGKRQKLLNVHLYQAMRTISKIKRGAELYKTICSILFWTEGSKKLSSLSFTNSDPKMINFFLRLLRLSFSLDESKFRVKVHIHNYHNDLSIKNYWSKVTKIPLTQFTRSYKKPNTKKRIHKDYKGCVNIRYYDYKIALELSSIYNKTSESLGL
ncbi:hypothetical protein A2863_04855 [Candidatus Woesebacteria bacterium RIFCSPHIGHO2_01_FULL_38_9b]|uniref:Resolvase HTH domain-containing protein n=1 Tax=Candidatus Woesebacteria bacterium RIFCSPHIGHO2_01_FULL_38_9b TaxID=1802493 RepID=A0A1F7XZI1_9BACT|nr:MAG: hypothetical protein A2863_04855 [Candidatus Woesebacteria bacterium RIFCSPHIGHO2_01_FULL_38_9b]